MADATNTTTAQTVPSIDDQITALQADVADLKNQVAELKTTRLPICRLSPPSLRKFIPACSEANHVVGGSSLRSRDRSRRHC